MRIGSISISNPIGAITKIREYGRHFKFSIDWKSISIDDQRSIAEICRADESRLYISLIVPVVDNYMSLDKCRLHIANFQMNPSFDALNRVDKYIEEFGKLPHYCGVEVELNAEEKVNLMSLI